MPSSPSRIHLVSLVGRGGRPDFTRSLGWRLLGANNRELGRGCTAALTVDELVALIDAYRVRLPEASFTHVQSTASDGWRWIATDPRGEIAYSSRSYRRERESRYSAKAFGEGFTEAEVRIPESALRMSSVSISVFMPHSGLVTTP